MGQWALSPSQLTRPRRLADRLATEVRTEIREEAKKGGEATVSSMAERFAPEAQSGLAAGAGQPLIEPTVILQKSREPRRAPSVNRWVIAALTVVSLVPAALLLMVLWQSGVSFPRLSGAVIAEDEVQAPASQQASVVATPPIAKTTRGRAGHRADRSGQAHGEAGRGGRLRRHARYRRGAPRPKRRRHPRHAGGSELLARAPLRRERMEPQARRDRRLAASRARGRYGCVRHPHRPRRRRRHDPGERRHAARHRAGPEAGAHSPRRARAAASTI